MFFVSVIDKYGEQISTNLVNVNVVGTWGAPFWGAYGQIPVDDEPAEPDVAGAPAPNFKKPVHCVRIVDEKVYVCDCLNYRILVFAKSVVGTPCENLDRMEGVGGYLKETSIAAETFHAAEPRSAKGGRWLHRPCAC